MDQCVNPAAARALFYRQQVSMLLVGKMEEHQKLLFAVQTIQSNTNALGKFVLVLFIDKEDQQVGQTFLGKALSFAGNAPFCCDQISLTDKPVVDLATHKEMAVWIAYSSPKSRSMHIGLRSSVVFKMLRLMAPVTNAIRSLIGSHSCSTISMLSKCMWTMCKILW